MTFFRRRLLLNCLRFFDLGAIVASFGLAVLIKWGRTNVSESLQFLEIRASIYDFALFLLFLLGGRLAFSSVGLYHSRRFSTKGSEIADILKATALGSLALGLAGKTLGLFQSSLFIPMVFFAASSGLMISSRLILRAVLAKLRLRGRNLRFLLVVGTNERAIRFARNIEARPDLGYRIIGFVDDEWKGVGEFRQNGYALVANLSGLRDFIRHNVVDEVVLELPIKSLYQAASEIVDLCREQGIIVRRLTDIFSLHAIESVEDQVEGEPLITVCPGPKDGWPLLAKRTQDIFLSAILIVIMAPVFLLVALLVKLSSAGPVFFIQERVGLNKRRFRLFKFRTMVEGAERLQDELEGMNEISGPVFKITDDPRITAIGKFLRKTSIDELPQLINVLKGDMSLVGPRPLPVRDYNGFNKDWQRRRFSVRPGITCLWQISGRNNISFERWMQLDLQYIDRWSLSLDFTILAKTIPAVLKGTGAR
jgi:exopolysaccharide biosynthesis polyprenyl glycosylphosphotransferase